MSYWLGIYCDTFILQLLLDMNIIFMWSIENDNSLVLESNGGQRSGKVLQIIEGEPHKAI